MSLVDWWLFNQTRPAEAIIVSRQSKLAHKFPALPTSLSYRDTFFFWHPKLSPFKYFMGSYARESGNGQEFSEHFRFPCQFLRHQWSIYFNLNFRWTMCPWETALSMYMVSPRHEYKYKDNRLFSNLLALCYFSPLPQPMTLRDQFYWYLSKFVHF